MTVSITFLTEAMIAGSSSESRMILLSSSFFSRFFVESTESLISLDSAVSFVLEFIAAGDKLTLAITLKSAKRFALKLFEFLGKQTVEPMK